MGKIQAMAVMDGNSLWSFRNFTVYGAAYNGVFTGIVYICYLQSYDNRSIYSNQCTIWFSFYYDDKRLLSAGFTVHIPYDSFAGRKNYFCNFYNAVGQTVW